MKKIGHPIVFALFLTAGTIYAQEPDDAIGTAYTSNTSQSFRVVNLGSEINSMYDDYSAVEFSQAGALYFTSRQPGKAGSTKQAEKLKEQVLKAELTDSIASVAAPVKGLGSAKKHTAVAGYDPGKGQLFLYVGKKRGGRLVAYENHAKKGLRHVYTPSGGVDKKIYRETQISLTANGDAYFISNHHAGQGGFDIWYAPRKGKSRFGKAINLGPVVNTANDEVSVYVTPDGNTLYFASDGHIGMGGYDLFKSIKDANGQWSRPENLGEPINSEYHDVFYYPSSDTLSFLMSSNRPEGFGGMDIYRVITELAVPD